MRKSLTLFDRKWHETDASGHPGIDDEHRGLLDAMNRVETAIRAREDVATVYALLADVVQSCIDHFAHEEAILDDVRYPGADRHREEHAALANKMRSLMRQHATGDLATMEMLTALFYEPLVLHMVRDDRVYFPYLRAA